MKKEMNLSDVLIFFLILLILVVAGMDGSEYALATIVSGPLIIVLLVVMLIYFMANLGRKRIQKKQNKD